MNDPVTAAFRGVRANIDEAFRLHHRLTEMMDGVKKSLKMEVYEDTTNPTETVLRYRIADQAPSEGLAAAAGTVLYTVKNTYDMAIYAAHEALPGASKYRGYYPWCDAKDQFPQKLDSYRIDSRLRPTLAELQPWAADDPRAQQSVFRQLASIANAKHKLGVQTAAHPLPDSTGSYFVQDTGSDGYLRPMARWDQQTRTGELARWRGRVFWESPAFKGYIVLVDPKLDAPIDVFNHFTAFVIASARTTEALENACREELAAK
jgi:hypothetical protein